MSTEPTPDELLREAQALQRQGRDLEAISAYQHLLARWPERATAWFNLGVLQRKAHLFDDALASYQHALNHGISQPEEVHLNRAVIYSDYLRRDDSAVKELQAALLLNPAYLPAMLNLANVFEDVGRQEAAAALYERILALNPDYAEALARLANLQSMPCPDLRLPRRLRTAMERYGISPAERASLGFALGRLLDGSGQYEAAFAAYAGANRDSRLSIVPRVIEYDRRLQEDFVDRLIATPLPAPAPAAGRPPIFICGLFRSGSTLCEQILAGYPGMASGGELDLLPRFVAGELAPFPESMTSLPAGTLESLRSRYLAGLAQLFPAATEVTDKRLGNFLYIGLIKTLFPAAKIVHTRRDALDTCLSIYFAHLDQAVSYSFDVMDIGHYYRQYHRLMTHWKGRYATDIFDFDYDQLVAEPSATAQGLFSFLGLEGDERYLADIGKDGSVKTASVWQVRKPLYRSSSGRADHYAHQLAELRAYLADLLPARP